MDRNGAKKMLAILQSAYPKNYGNMTKEEMTDTVNLYTDMFSEHDESIVAHALKNYIRKNQYPPTIAGIIEQIDLIIGKQAPADYWNELMASAKKHNWYYFPQEAFDSLSDVCKRWIGRPSTLKELYVIDGNILNTVIRGEFLKSIGAVITSEEVQKSLPDEITRIIQKFKMELAECNFKLDFDELEITDEVH